MITRFHSNSLNSNLGAFSLRLFVVKETDRQTDRQTERQKDRQTNREIGKQEKIDRQETE